MRKEKYRKEVCKRCEERERERERERTTKQEGNKTMKQGGQGEERGEG